MSGVSQYSYLLAYTMIPRQYDNTNLTKAGFKGWTRGRNSTNTARIFLQMPSESISRVWLHAWVRYRGLDQGLIVSLIACCSDCLQTVFISSNFRGYLSATLICCGASFDKSYGVFFQIAQFIFRLVTRGPLYGYHHPIVAPIRQSAGSLDDEVLPCLVALSMNAER